MSALAGIVIFVVVTIGVLSVIAWLVKRGVDSSIGWNGRPGVQTNPYQFQTVEYEIHVTPEQLAQMQQNVQGIMQELRHEQQQKAAGQPYWSNLDWKKELKR